MDNTISLNQLNTGNTGMDTAVAESRKQRRETSNE